MMSITQGDEIAGPMITVPLPHTAHEIAALQVAAEADAREAVALVKVTDDATYTLADEVLQDVHAREKAVLAMRKSATGPMYQAAKVVESWFAPLLDALATIKAHAKTEMAAHVLRKATAEADARAAAALAANADAGGDELMTALTAADDAAQRPEGKASVAMAWKVKRILEDELPDEYWTPNLAQLDVIAKSHRGDDPPFVRGVVFERVAKIGARS